MNVRTWWDRRASERDQDAVLFHLNADRAWAGVPWAFLPEPVQHELRERVVIDEARLSCPVDRIAAGGVQARQT